MRAPFLDAGSGILDAGFWMHGITRLDQWSNKLAPDRIVVERRL